MDDRFRTLARIWGILTESYVELGGNCAMFPYPLKDWGGANGIWAIIEVVKDFVSVPSRGLGGSNEKVDKPKYQREKFPSPPEDFWGLTVLGQNIVQLFFRFRPLARIRGGLTQQDFL